MVQAVISPGRLRGQELNFTCHCPLDIKSSPGVPNSLILLESYLVLIENTTSTHWSMEATGEII